MAGFDVSFWSLLFKLLARQTGRISKVRFEPQKPHFENTPILQPFERATPESQGVPSDHIREFLTALAEDRDASPHHVIVMRHGKIIAECSYAPYVKGMWHITHSMCKSVTGMAVGFAVEEGLVSLDETLESIFPDLVPLLNKIRPRSQQTQITIENLLNMTSEVEFSEAGAISGNDWRKGYMSSSVKCEPGTKWDYNSMNSYMLSAVIQEKSGMSMFQYLKPRLFDPLGIDRIYWEFSPEGITKGGWGMFLRPEDAVKLGYLYMNGGRWRDRQIISEEWVRRSISPQTDNGSYGYGYQIWMGQRPGSFAYNGLFGQNVICDPDDDMIIMVNAGNRELFASGAMTEILQRYWGISYRPSDTALAEDRKAYEALQNCIGVLDGTISVKEEKPRRGWGLFPRKVEVIDPKEMMETLKGASFRMEGGGIGLFPLISQVMHNNFTDGISEIGFDEEDGVLVVLFREGKEIHRIRVGLDKPEISEILLHAEPYYVGTKGRIATDENDRLCLILDIHFIEEGNLRQIKLFFEGETIEMRCNEKPGDAVIVDALEYTSDTNTLSRVPFVNRLVEGGGLELMDVTIQSTIHPTDFGRLIHE